MLEKEFKYYLDNQKDLLKEFLNKYIIIKDQKVVASFNTKQEAYDYATEKFELGSFLIQHCLPGDLGHTQTFHSQVIFSI
tara:strand:- start:3139 stop:3378 length:240 start_codon:yes stop_codon:yes gene_type:complete